MSPDNGNPSQLPEPTLVVPKRDLYPVCDVAVLLGGISERKVWSLLDQGRIESVKLDGRRLVPHEALMAFRKSLPDATFATHPGGGAGTGPGGGAGTGPKTEDVDAMAASAA